MKKKVAKKKGKKVAITSGEFTDTHGAARYLGKSYETMKSWRWQGTGPKYYKVGGSVRYYIYDLEAFIMRGSV